MAAAKKGAGRYKPGAYKRPEAEEIEIEGLGTFLVQPLTTKDQEEIEAAVTQKEGESDKDFGLRRVCAKISAALIEPPMTPEQIEADSSEWTNMQGVQFGSLVGSIADGMLGEEDLADLRSRFRPQKDDGEGNV